MNKFSLGYSYVYFLPVPDMPGTKKRMEWLNMSNN
jgi:hypothetical protein